MAEGTPYPADATRTDRNLGRRQQGGARVPDVRRAPRMILRRMGGGDGCELSRLSAGRSRSLVALPKLSFARIGRPFQDRAGLTRAEVT